MNQPESRFIYSVTYGLSLSKDIMINLILYGFLKLLTYIKIKFGNDEEEMVKFD